MTTVQNSPVVIQKQGRNIAVLMSYTEYQRLTKNSGERFEDICGRIRKNAADRGLTEKLFSKILAPKIG